MGQKAKQGTKICETCGNVIPRKRFNGRLEDFTLYNRRKHCSQRCFGEARRKENPGDSALHKRALAFRKDSCEMCGTSDSLAVHHLDKNPANNRTENLMTLCGRCHTMLHWQEGKTMPTRQTPCVVCGERSKGLNLCSKHYRRYKTTGNPLLTMYDLKRGCNPRLNE